MPADLPTLIVLQAPAEALAYAGPVVYLTLEQIEDGQHGLSPEQGPFLVTCRNGNRAALAARYLRADGLQAGVWNGDESGN